MRQLTLGIGCRHGTSAACIAAAVNAALARLGPPPAEIRAVATIDAKANEPGLLAFCRQRGLPLTGIARARIHEVSAADARADADADADRQSAVYRQFGVLAVAAPCALLAAPGGRLVLGKFIQGGVTVAIAENT